jgi:hypothetical protein
MKTPISFCVLLLAIATIPLFAQEQKVEPASANALLAVVPCGSPVKYVGPDGFIPAVFLKQTELANYTKGEVHIRISLETDQKARPCLVARLTPNPGFFISSKNLPDGFTGIRTIFTLVSNAMIRARGPVFEDTPAQEALVEPDMLVSYYPAGTVTLRLPVAITNEGADISARVMLTYSACGNGICTMPERDPVEIRITSTALSAIGIPAKHQ